MINIEKYIDHDFHGCVLVTVGDSFRFQKAYGYADLPNKRPNQIDTKFGTASAGKAFVAVGVLQLIETGLLSLDSRIGDILDFDLKAIDKNITIRQLLSHTSGIPDYFDESVMDEYDELWRDFPNYKIRTSMDLLPLFIDKPMMYPAGEKFKYNNSGYVMLGIVIEKITSISFDEYLRSAIFAPCDMMNTGYYELDRLPANCANAYIYDTQRDEYYTNIYSVDAKGTGAGGAFTTVLDIEKFWNNLLGGKLISKDMLNEMFTPQSEEDYGLGMWLKRVDSHKLYPYFQGSDPGVSFVSLHDLENSISISIVSNFGDNVWQLRNKLLAEVQV